ncbi:hypothetical protein NSA19_07335 [Actinomyces bowdenii]|uniref:hypothetical protein n=1 Tax=Actinomyces bowdenii TaxID=131109 RepID=UPI00214AC336|nr:hypothetical protein [Actinomyces bowdenii]MCR2052663.1 hypothetical protein [Actinomyces bowdenii]
MEKMYLRHHRLLPSITASRRALITISVILILALISALGYWWHLQQNKPQPFSDPHICRFMETREIEKSLNHRVGGAHIVRKAPDMECNIYPIGMPSLVLRESSKPDAVVVAGYGTISLAELPSRPVERPSDTVYEVNTGIPDSSAYVALTRNSPYPAFAVWFSPGTNHTVIIVQGYDRDYTDQDYDKELEALITYTAKAFDHAYRTGETPQPQPT